MKWRGLRALGLALVLLPGQAAAAVSTLKLEFPVRVAQEDMPLALPDVSPPRPDRSAGSRGRRRGDDAV